MILLDTDICVELLRGNRDIIKKRRDSGDHVALCFMTVAELFYGAEKSPKKALNKILVEKFLLAVEIINSDVIILKKFGEIKTVLEKQGQPVADADILIAATAITKCDKLITGNIKHFKRFVGLKLENWLK